MTPALTEDLNHVLAHTDGLWNELRNQRIFVTGGTGFIGCWLLESLLAAEERWKIGVRVTLLIRRPEALLRRAPHLAAHPGITLLEGDVKSFEFPDGEFSHIVHAAAESSTILTDREPLAMFDTIVHGTQRVLELARRAGTRRFLFLSSGAVYGPQPPDVTQLSEMYSGAPYPFDEHSAYGEGKRAAELLCACYRQQYGLDVKIARGFTFVGPCLPLDAHFAIGNFIRDVLQGGPIRVNGDGLPQRSYLYAADLAVWLWTILLRGEQGSPYNVGSENAVTIGALAQLVADTLRPGTEVRIARRPAPDSAPSRYVPSTRRARVNLGLAEHIALPEAIRRTAKWEAQRLMNSKVQQ